ncbi:MAG: SDR family oxidoreductase [Pseudomonadales bacterium]
MTDNSMRGKVCLITGATSGIGKASSLALAKQDASLVLVARNTEKAAQLKQYIKDESGNEDVDLIIGNLASLADIRRIAQDFIDSGKPLHVLLNNAGVTNMKRVLTVDGYEEMFAVNHLAYFLLTHLLLDRLKGNFPARIVNVASGAHAYCKSGINFEDINFEKGFGTMKVYGHSKLANILFTHQLAKKLEGSNVTVNCCHPGAVATGLGSNNGVLGKLAMTLLKPFFLSPEQGAATSIYLATSEEIQGSGGYYADCKPATVKPWAKDDAAAEWLWEMSLEMTGLTES